MTILPSEDMKHFPQYKQIEIQPVLKALLAGTVQRDDLLSILAQLQDLEPQKNHALNTQRQGLSSQREPATAHSTPASV
jgi:hypothetical protein